MQSSASVLTRLEDATSTGVESLETWPPHGRLLLAAELREAPDVVGDLALLHEEQRRDDDLNVTTCSSLLDARRAHAPRGQGTLPSWSAKILSQR